MGDSGAFEKRKEYLDRLFVNRYSSHPQRWVSSPGRVEIIGDHTDYNKGKVIVSSISCDILGAVSARDDGTVEIVAEDYTPVSFSVRDLGMREREKGKSIALARGVLRYLKDAGYSFGGFQAVTHSEVFYEAGFSAAFEVFVAEIVNRLYLGGTLSPLVKAYAGQYAENAYFGKPSGFFDQAGAALGGFHEIDFGGEGGIVRVPSLEGYKIVITNTGGPHEKLLACHADIRREMSEVAAYFGKTVLRELTVDLLQSELPYLRQKVSDRAILRAFHFFEENERADRAAEALKSGDRERFFAQIRLSGESSLGFLQNCYVPGEIYQPVVLALKLSDRFIKDGAYRLQGGGLGTVFAFCKEGTERRYGGEMARVFGKENVYYADLRSEGACELII